MIDVRGVHVGPDAQNAAALHRFEAVLDHVVKNLLHLVAIELKQRKIGTQFLLDDDVAILDSPARKSERLPPRSRSRFPDAAPASTAGSLARIA